MSVERVDMGGYTLIEHASLARLNTLRVDARANLLADIRDAAKLPELLDFPAVRQGRLLVLGEGSNVLFTGDFDGTVLLMSTRGVQVESDGDSARIAVAAGERWDDFVRWTLGQGYAGLENLILIPGTVGAAPIQNIGAYGCEVAEFVESVEAWDIRERRVVTLDHATCSFAYRDSLFKHQPGRYIVTAVRFVLPRSRPLRTDYAGIAEQLARMGVDKPAPFHVAEAVVHRPRGDRQCRQLLQESDHRCRAGRCVAAGASGPARVAAARWPLQDFRRMDDRGGWLQGPARRRCRHLQPARAGAGQPRQRQRSATVGVGAAGDDRCARPVRRAARTRTRGDRRGLNQGRHGPSVGDSACTDQTRPVFLRYLYGVAVFRYPVVMRRCPECPPSP
jgi:UDP-N-acetylenolpyruvoylglucosamine reductase